MHVTARTLSLSTLLLLLLLLSLLEWLPWLLQRNLQFYLLWLSQWRLVQCSLVRHTEQVVLRNKSFFYLWLELIKHFFHFDLESHRCHLWMLGTYCRPLLVHEQEHGTWWLLRSDSS